MSEEISNKQMLQKQMGKIRAAVNKPWQWWQLTYVRYKDFKNWDDSLQGLSFEFSNKKLKMQASLQLQ